jgi:hypothetical protein
MAIDKDALLAAIDAAKENAYGTDEQSTLGTRRRKAIEAYLGLNTNPAPEGRSQVVDRSVYETIQTQLPSLVKIFAGSSEEVCKCTPLGPDDEMAAEQHTAVLNYIVTAQNRWEQICADWIHDAMLLANSYCMAYWDDSENIVQETYEGQSDDQVAALLSDTSITVVQHSQRIDEEATSLAQKEWQQQAQQAAQQGVQLPPPQPVATHDLVIERREHDGKVCIRVLPPEHCYVSSDTPDWTLKECPYFEFKQEKTIAELRAQGLDVPDDIGDDEDDDSVETTARDRFDEDRFGDDAKGSMRRVWARMVWIRADAEGDDKSRLYYAILVGRTVLFCQQVARIPVSSMTAQPLPHRHIGMSEAETVDDIQDTKTAIKRGALDNLYLMNAGRHAISNKVNLEDFLDARPGGLVRMLDDSLPSEGHIMPLVHPVAFEQTIGSLEYFDQERQNRSGAMRGAAGLEANAMNRAAVGTTIAMQSHSSMRMEHKARMMAPAVEELFACVQEILQKHSNKALTIKLRGKWTTVDPQAWRTKRDLRISVGVGAGNKESMAMQLQGQLGAQLQLMPLGLARPENLYATVIELAKLGGFANPERFWTDPTTSPPMPQPPSPEMVKAQSAMQIKQMELQANAQQFQAEMQAKYQELQAQHQAKIQEIQANLELQNANDARDAMREQRKAETDAQVELLKEENKKQVAAMQAEIEKYKADLDAQVKLTIAQNQAQAQAASGEQANTAMTGVQKLLQDMSEQMSAPAEIVRGPDGKAIGVKKGQTTRVIKRDDAGKAVGLQ